MVSDAGGFDDKSFNQSGYEGLQKAKKDLGVQVKTVESNKDSDYGPNVNGLVKQNCGLIVTVGFNLATTTGDAAKANPDTKFAIVDATAQDKDGKAIEVKNVKPILFNTAEAAYLGGYVAAAQSKTGKVATFGGIKIPSVTIFMDGFVDGVARYNKDNDKGVKALGWNKKSQSGSFTNSFDDVSKGKTLSQGFIDQGADVILPVAGPVGAGALAAAKTKPGTMVVWVDSDGVETNPDSKSVILTSVVKQIGAAVEDVTKATQAGKFSSDPYVGTLKNDGVGLAPFHEFDSKVSAKTKKQLKQLKQDIIDGKLKVESKSTPK